MPAEAFNVVRASCTVSILIITLVHFKIANKKKNVFFKRSCFLFFKIGPCGAQREAHSFQPQMKLEAVDKRSPGLIRVATVEEVDTHRIKVFSSLRPFLLVGSGSQQGGRRGLGFYRCPSSRSIMTAGVTSTTNGWTQTTQTSTRRAGVRLPVTHSKSPRVTPKRSSHMVTTTISL